MYPFVRPNPLQQVLDAINGGQELPVTGGGYAPPSLGPAAGGIPPGDPMAAIMARLSAPAPTPQTPVVEQPSKKQRALVAIADALAAYGSLRAGQNPQALATTSLYERRRQEAQDRETERYGKAKAAADADRQSALLEYQRLQAEKQQAAEESRALRTAALGLGIDPGSMTDQQLTSAIAGGAEKKNLKERQKEGRELLQAIAETGTEVPEETGARLLAGEPGAIAKAYRGLGLATNARLQEKYQNERELAELRGEIDIKKKGAPSAPKPEDTAKNRVKWQKKAEEVMKGLAGYVGGFKGELKSGKITSDEIRTQLQAALDSRGLDAESAAADPVVAEERQRVINYFTRHFGPALREYDARVRVGG